MHKEQEPKLQKIKNDRAFPSEKGLAYKMKLEALSRQGKSSVQSVQQITDEVVAENAGESETQIQMFISLTKLNKYLRDMVDVDFIELDTGVELSHLRPNEQDLLANVIETEFRWPSLPKAIRMRQLSEDGLLTEGRIIEIMTDRYHANDQYIRVDVEKYAKLFGDLSVTEREQLISKALEHYSRYMRRLKNKEAKKEAEKDAQQRTKDNAVLDALYARYFE